jgi:hypothetical protein
MKILKEKVDNEHYIEILLSDKEVHRLATYHILACPLMVGRRTYNLGVRLITNREEEEDAVVAI